MVRLLLKAAQLVGVSLLLMHATASAIEPPAVASPAAVPPGAATAPRRELAPPPEARVRFAGNLVLEHQFNTLATLVYTDGTQVDIGSALFGLTAGAAFPLTRDGRFELQGLGGFLVSKANASNGSVSFWTFPIEVTAHANLGRWRLGAGPTLHVAPRFRSDSFGSTPASSIDFDTRVGALGQIEFLATPRIGFALRGTWLQLSSGGASIDASRIGGAMTFYL